jgi:NodT family efflux transporter outer membrane factor (OMF) lipoprotein
MAPAGNTAANPWWQQFGDARLETLLRMARNANPGLQSAALRISQAQAQLGITQAGTRPSAQLSTGASFTKPDTRSQLLGKTDGSTAAQFALQSSWEPDFWGKVRRGIESDQANFLSSVAAFHAAQVSLEASVASTYFGWRTIGLRIAIAEANLKQQADSLRIAEARFHAGATSELDRHQAQAQFEQTQAQIPLLRASSQQAAHALSILLGQAPDYYDKTFAATDDMPQPPTALPRSLPRDLLQRRPDVVQAELAAMAQSARIGQAQSALYPSFSLSGSFGFQASDAGGDSLSELFSWNKQVRSLSAGLLFPIFDRGRLVNQVKVQDALFEQALRGYENQVLKAQQEVEDALSTIASSSEARLSLLRARDAVRKSAALSMQRYLAGASDYTTVTTSDQARLQVEDALQQSEGNLLQAWVAVFRALGGGWDGDLSLPELAQQTSGWRP